MAVVIVSPELPPREENKLDYADILALAIRETLDDEKFRARHTTKRKRATNGGSRGVAVASKSLHISDIIRIDAKYLSSL